MGAPVRRVRGLLLAGTFVLTIFAAQLVRIQGFDASSVAAEARAQRTATVAIPALRGTITSSDGVVLAQSQERITIVADPTAVCTYQTKKNTCDPATSDAAVTKAAEALAPLLPRSALPTLPAALTPVVAEMRRIERLTDPRNLYSYCLACRVE